MLDYDEWKKVTKRGPLTPRSSKLKDLDKALKGCKAVKNAATLRPVETALNAWIAKKGVNWKQSTRNSDGAVEALQALLIQKLAPFGGVNPGGVNRGTMARGAQRVSLRALPAVAHYHTMTDDAQVTIYTDGVKTCFRNHWDITQPVQTGTHMLQGLLNVHNNCGIPPVGIDIKALPDGYNGFFDFPTWTIQISEKKFNQFDMVYANPPANTVPHEWFVNVAETLYHEGRHCEQWWHMARYSVHGKQPVDVTQQLGIPLNIATAAARNPMKFGDPMMGLTEGWFKSVYGGARRGIVLHGLGLKRNPHPSPTITPAEQGGAMIHEQYSKHLAEEVDAWRIQDLVRAKF